ncbi:MAG: OmpH family outer membrane protein [Lacipirellulaceae bacterium]
MKTQFLAAAAALVVALAPSAFAQSPASANAQKFGVAVIDINYIFKNHQKFRTAMDGMKGDFTAVDTALKAKQEEIVRSEQQLQGLKAGSPDFEQLDNQLLQMKAALQVEVTQKRKELVEQEATIYFDTYVEVSKAIEYYAQRQGLGLVLRFNGDEADPHNRDSILRAINKAVHYQNQVDITPDVLALLNRAGQPAAQQAARPAATPQ